MRSPALGIGYSLWLKLRWVIGGVIVLMLLLAVAALLFPVAAPFFGGASIVILCMSMAFLLNAFSFGPADLGVKSSGVPTHMRALPVSTSALVGWPMLYAALTVAALWALPVCLIFIPAGFPLPVLWPATMFVALCVWVQAIGWSPMPSPFARVPLLIVALTPLILPLALGLTFFKGGNLTAVVSASCLGWSAVAYVFGVRGLSRARTGSEGVWFRALTNRWAARARQRHGVGLQRRPFRSAFAAQLWHDCRRNAIVLPVMIGFVGLPVLAMRILAVFDIGRPTPIAIGSVLISADVLQIAAWVVLPLGFAMTQSGGVAKFDVWGKIPMAAFFATRPMSTNRFILIKMCSTAISVLAAWGVTFCLFAIWAMLEMSTLNPRPSIVRAALTDATPRTIAISIAVLFGLLALTWRNMVSGMWPTLTGRKQLSVAIGFAFLVPYVLAAIIGTWIYRHPAYHANFWLVLPWFVCFLIALKLGAAAFVSSAVQKRGLISGKVMGWLAIGWLVLAGCVVGGLSLVVAPTWGMVAIVVLSLPFPSLAAMTLALDWNRHR